MVKSLRLYQDISEAFGDKVAVHYYRATLEDEKAYEQDGMAGTKDIGAKEHIEDSA